MPRSTLFLALCLALAACEGKPDTPRSTGAPAGLEIGDLAPDYRGSTLKGEPLALSDLRGRVVLLNVWATWCEPCREELPDLRALHLAHEARGLTVVGVSVDAARDVNTLRSTVTDFNLPYPVIHDARNHVSQTFRVSGYPTSFVLDRAGAIRWRRDGLIPRGDPGLAAALEAALAAP